MKSFIVLFTAAREVSTPLVAVRIFGTVVKHPIHRLPGKAPLCDEYSP